MSKIVLKLVNFSVFVFCLVVFDTSAQTAQQVEQFKNMPRAQQEQLAKQMGIDISSFSGQSGTSNSLQNSSQQNITYPRGTQFDEYGNPINSKKDIFSQEPKSDADNTLTLYGLELFASSPSTFSPVSDVPVPGNYIIGPGDELVVQLFGKENVEYRLKVDRNGAIVIPTLGPFSIATKSFSETKGYLSEMIKNQILGVDVSLSMGELRTMRIFVLGEAYKPGAYNVSSLSTITHALFVSGGVSDIASLRNIQLKRAGKLIETLDLYDLLNNGDTSNDALLQQGDAIFIPAIEKSITVDGQVRRPAIYELKQEESLSAVIELAGGKLAKGYDSAVNIRRFINGEQIQLTVDLNADDIKVIDGDQVTVSAISPFVANSITLIGAVARPGAYQYKKGMHLTDVIENTQKDLLEIADLTYVLILRTARENQDLDILQVDLTEHSQGKEKNHILLQPNDKILVFSLTETEIEEFGDIPLEDLAFTQKELELQEKARWEKRIENRLFWANIGLADSDTLKDSESPQSKPIIELTDVEKENILEYKDSAYFSRKRMLAPVIKKLKEQAKYGRPVKVVEIAGEVKVPGLYPLSDNASAKSLIKAAGGLTESSYLKKSEITRTYINTDGIAQVSHISFSLNEILSDKPDNDVNLVSKDRINIFSIPSWQEELKVSVKGEVQFPGEYTIRRGETLSGLLERVGRLTQYGDSGAVVFTREGLKAQEKKNLQGLSEELRKQIASESLRSNSGTGSIVSYDEAKKLLKDLSSAEAIGRLVIDFQSILDGEIETAIVLEDGDALYVPVRSQSVNVIGEVYVPTSHMYDSALSFEEYISKSGGYRSLADMSRVYIIRANGSVQLPGSDNNFWFSGQDKTVGVLPGDTIVVPFDTDNVDNLTLWSSATQIIYQLAVAVAAISSL